VYPKTVEIARVLCEKVKNLSPEKEENFGRELGRNGKITT